MGLATKFHSFKNSIENIGLEEGKSKDKALEIKTSTYSFFGSLLQVLFGLQCTLLLANQMQA